MTKNKTSLSEEDLLAVIDLHNRFVGCKTRADLNDCLLRHFLPLLDSESTAFGWVDPELATKANIAGFAGITAEDAERFAKLTPYGKSMNKKILTGARAVVACDVDVPRKTAGKELSLYYRDNPGYQCPADAIVYAGSGKTVTTYMLTLDKSESGLGAGVHRWMPNDKPFTLRDVRVLELVRPILFQTIKTIVLSDELAKYKSLSESLADIPTGVALVRKDMRVVFLNKSFRDLIPLEPGHKLPPDLETAVQKEMGRHKRSAKVEEVFPEIPFYKSAKGTFALHADLVNADAEEPCFLLRLKPADDAFSQMSLRMQEGSLSNREKEICCLVKDGFSDAEIASRLFISLHTVRTHMKSIHLKLDVQSRARLVALLNQTG